MRRMNALMKQLQKNDKWLVGKFEWARATWGLGGLDERDAAAPSVRQCEERRNNNSK